MILSGRDVEWYVANGLLTFLPILAPEQFQQNGVDLILDESSPRQLAHGCFCLGRTRELVTLPNDLMAFVQLRSTWARRGIMLPPTIVDAGFHGTLTLEIAAFGAKYPDDVRDYYTVDLPVGQRFVHLIFAKLTNPTTPYRGKYQGQVEITGPIKD